MGHDGALTGVRCWDQIWAYCWGSFTDAVLESDIWAIGPLQEGRMDIELGPSIDVVVEPNMGDMGP